MIKKLHILFALPIMISFAGSVTAQCIPDPNNTALITPDTTTNFVSGTVGVPYTQVILLHPPLDTVYVYNGVPLQVHVLNIQLTNLDGLPPGLSYTCNPASCDFAGGVSGCAVITGTPTTAGYYPLQAIIASTGTVFGGTVTIGPVPDTISAYSITINNPSAVQEYSKNNFTLIDMSPNPAKDFMMVHYNSPVQVKAELTISNVLGEKISKINIASRAGENNLRVNTKNLAAGIYVFSLRNGPYNLTRKFVVSKQ